MEYTTRSEAIERESIVAIEAGSATTRGEYDVEAIASEVLGHAEYGGYAVVVDGAEFWASVERNAL